MRSSLIRSLLATLCLSGVVTTQAQSNYEPYAITTLAGEIARALFNQPVSVAVDKAGNIFVADTLNHAVRKVTPDSFVSTFAGFPGNSGSVDGVGSAARFNAPQSIAVDSAGNVYVADTGNHIIRQITPGGAVSTLAGSAGVPGNSDGSGTAARFNAPAGIAVDGIGNIYVADTFNETIRKITTTGTVSTFAGLAGTLGSADGKGVAARFYYPIGIAVDSSGNVYVGDTNNNTIRKIISDGTVNTFAGAAGSTGSNDGTGNAARFYSPRGLTLDGTGNLYVADFGNSTIRKITSVGVVSTWAGSAGVKGSVDASGVGASFNSPQGVGADGSNNIYVADSLNHTIRKITPATAVTTFAGTSGVSGKSNGGGAAANFNNPAGLAFDSSGTLYVADRFNHAIRKVFQDGSVITFAGLVGSSGRVDGTGAAARFSSPVSITIDTTDTLYVAEEGNAFVEPAIRKITPAGVVTTLVTSTGAAFGHLIVDAAGNLYVAAYSAGVLLVTQNGTVTSYAPLSAAYGITLDTAKNLYVTANNVVYKIAPDRVVTPFAGSAGNTGSADGVGDNAQFASSLGPISIDRANNLYVLDRGDHTIRKITPDRVVTTLAGAPGVSGYVNGRGGTARFGTLAGVALDTSDRVFISDVLDPNGGVIRMGVPGSTPPPIPAITSPLVEIGSVNQQFVYQVESTGATSLSVSNLPAGLTFMPALAAITGKPTMTGTFQVDLSASNAFGTTMATLSLTLQSTSTNVPIITSGTSAKGRVGERFNFQVSTIGGTSSVRVNSNGLPPGLALDSVTGLISGIPSSEGSSAVALTADDGNFSSSSTLQLTFTADPALPVIVSANTALLTPGEEFSYKIKAPGNSNPPDPTTYTLVFNLPSGLFFDAQTGIISGTFTGSAPFGASAPTRPDLSGGIISNVQLFATNSHGTATLPLIFFLAPTGAVNIATRIAVGTNDNVLIAGFIITGNAPKKVIIRAIGPSLPVPGALQDPTLELHDAGSLLGTNNNWRDAQENEIKGTGIPPTDERESAILAYLNPGNYTAVVRGANNAAGIAVVEVYDLGTASLDSSSNAKLAQISTRGTVLTGDNVMIGGFIIKQEATKVIVRAIGPSLSAFGVGNALQDPTLELHDGSGSTIVSNDDWRTTQAQQIIDTTVPPKDDRESAIVATLNPGAYTAIVRGKGDKTGVALVEVYGLQ